MKHSEVTYRMPSLGFILTWLKHKTLAVMSNTALTNPISTHWKAQPLWSYCTLRLSEGPPLKLPLEFISPQCCNCQSLSPPPGDKLASEERQLKGEDKNSYMPLDHNRLQDLWHGSKEYFSLHHLYTRQISVRTVCIQDSTNLWSS